MTVGPDGRLLRRAQEPWAGATPAEGIRDAALRHRGRQADRALARRAREGRHRRVAAARESRLRRLRRPSALRPHRERRGERAGGAAARRGERRGRHQPARRVPAALARPAAGAEAATHRQTAPGGSDEPTASSRSSTATRSSSADANGDIEASLDRSDRPLLVRHAVPVEVGADRQRRAAQPAVGRRPAVLRDPLLPRAGHRDRLHRREALGDPAARRRRTASTRSSRS